MSRGLISRNPTLQRLRDEGFNVSTIAGHLVLDDVPYVNANREVKRGRLVSTLDLNSDQTQRPQSHVMFFAGEHPCDEHGAILRQIAHNSGRQTLAPGLVVDHSFSSKPTNGYADYYEKMSTYARILWGPAHAIDPTCTPLTFPIILPEEPESVFCYEDTASSRAGIAGVTSKLVVPNLAIVGVGGTGSYVLDLVAKTPPGEIHLYDGDLFLQHNAFRSPGAASKEQLERRANKAEHFAAVYSAMRRNIIPHPYHIDTSNVAELTAMSFVFVCVDKGAVKRIIIEALEAAGVPFVDVGMGINLVDGALQGALRVTTSTSTQRHHVRKHLSLVDAPGDDAYHQNIQIAELNAMNAALAVIKWKKTLTFYHDLEREHHCTYTIDGNNTLNEDAA